MGTVVKILAYIVGIIILLFGLMIFVFALESPVLFAGQYLIFAFMVIAAGGIIMYGGHRSGRKK